MTKEELIEKIDNIIKQNYWYPATALIKIEKLIKRK